MKFIVSIVLIFLGVFSTLSFRTKPQNKSTNEQGIRFFKGTMQQAIDLAKKENKLIFLDAYASWCGPCKMMKHKTFTDEQVGTFYNEHFINIAIDMEKGEGPRLSGIYSIRAYPTLLYFNSDGKMLNKKTGYHRSEEFLEIGKKIIKHQK